MTPPQTSHPTPQTPLQILLLEDDAILGDILGDYLEEQQYDVVRCYTVREVNERLDRERFDLYLFDINLPDGTGVALLEELRHFEDTTPAIVITAYDDTAHLLKSFDSGADDFIRKPFDLEELGARIRNLLKSRGLQHGTIAIDGEMTFDPATHELFTADGVRQLSAKESQLLNYLIHHRGRVVSVTELLHNLWEYDEVPGETAIRTYIKTLRSLIGRERITNIRGEGYRFEPL
jgi:two-component system OmpR family response regulator